MPMAPMYPDLQADAAGDRHSVLAQTAMNVELASCSFCGSSDPVDRSSRIRRPGRDQSRLAHGGSGLDEKIERVVVYGERRDLRAVVPRQIFPLPTRAIFRSDKVTLVADKIAFDAFHAGANDARGEIVDPFEIVAVVEAGGERRIAAPVDR